ncbi:unnamed protein product [Cylicocyclus nassatus]|uniref:Transthyretin-like family protein n=1 Tax=Cylicocyclus nassatus TaxID=53992 RepID=A0AA36M943_CYLNA|nr:unnamed protein product [Cylicocyclus nassatus]
MLRSVLVEYEASLFTGAYLRSVRLNMKPFLLLLAVVIVTVHAKMQNVTVKGTTICNKKRMANVLVELWERDRFDPNDLLESVQTNAQGEFLVKGGQSEIGGIEPFLRITHTCNVKPGCKRITEFDIPKSKIGVVYDMTYVPLDIIGAVDKEKC